MDNRVAIYILNSLIEGIDPTTHQPLPQDSALTQMVVSIALMRAKQALEAMPSPPSLQPSPPATKHRRPKKRHLLKDLLHFRADAHPGPLAKESRPRAGRVWTPSEQHQLRTLAAQGLSDIEIAERLGRGEMSISVQKYKLGICAARTDLE